MFTPYHAKYFAYELTKRCSADSLEKFAGAVAGAQVDLKRWHYVLIPCSTISENMTLAALTQQFGGFATKEEN